MKENTGMIYILLALPAESNGARNKRFHINSSHTFTINAKEKMFFFHKYPSHTYTINAKDRMKEQ